MLEDEVEFNEEDLEVLKKLRSQEFIDAFKIIIRDLVAHASIPNNIDLACDIDNNKLCIEAIKEVLEEDYGYKRKKR